VSVSSSSSEAAYSSSSSGSGDGLSMARQLRKVSGGAAAATSSSKGASFSWSALWGVLGVVAVLGNAIRRLLPIALEPFGKAAGAAGAFTPALWAQYAAFALFMAYAEGYKGFQLKFSPLVVKRALTLAGPGAPLLHKLLAAPYSMGLFHASRKRKAVSWGLAIGIVGLVKLVKGLAYPYRSIVDAGVVVGLSYGALSIAAIYAKTLVSGHAPDVDPALPDAAAKTA
jgi:hypothetical protein